MAMGLISCPDLKAARAVLEFGGGLKTEEYWAWRRVRTSIWERVNATAVDVSLNMIFA